MRKELLIFSFLIISHNSMAVLTWTQKPSIPSFARSGASGFAIGTKIYYGTGYNSGTVAQTDIWEFDTQAGTWTQKADITSARYGASGFSYNGKGYMAFGVKSSPWVYYNDIQEYDPLLNTWTLKSPMPATPRYGASVFVIYSKAYFVCGNAGSAFGPYTDETWEYDIINDAWLLRSPFPGGARYYTTSFAIDNFGYCGTGGIKLPSGQYSFNKDFYRYDPGSNIWTVITDFPGDSVSGAVSFVLNNVGFVGTGNTAVGVTLGAFFSYNPLSGSWSAAPSLPAGFERSLSYGLNTLNAGYLATGNNLPSYYTDLWELSDMVGINENFAAVNMLLKVNYNEKILSVQLTGRAESFNGIIKLINSGGQEIFVFPVTKQLMTFDISPYKKGIYLVEISGNRRLSAVEIFFIY